MFLDGAPLLKTFHFRSRSLATHGYAAAKTLPPFAFAPLKQLPKLVSVVLEWRTESFAALKDVLPASLRELTVTLKDVPPYAELDATLSGLSILETLSLNTGDTDPESIFGPGTIPRPEIRTLRITGTTSACVFFTNVLSTPETATLHLSPTHKMRQSRLILGSMVREKLMGQVQEPATMTWGIAQAGTEIVLSIWLSLTVKTRILACPDRPAAEVTLESEGNTFELFCSALGPLDVHYLILRSLNPNEEIRWTTLFMSLESIKVLVFPNAHLATSIHCWLDRRVYQLPPTILFPNLTQLTFVYTKFAHADDGSPSGPPRREGWKRAVSWEWLKAYLAKRKEEEVEPSWLVLENVTGLQTANLHELKGLVRNVTLNGERTVLEESIDTTQDTVVVTDATDSEAKNPEGSA